MPNDFTLTPVDHIPDFDTSDVAMGVPVDQQRGRLVINPRSAEAASMTHGAPDAAAEGVGRRVRQTGQNLYDTFLGPAERLGRAATSGTLDVTDPSTAGDALGLVGSVAGARMPFAEPGAAGIFGGQASKTADLNKLVQAQKMFKEGTSNRQIWESTGWFMGPDTKWRYEIPDFGTKMLREPGFGVSSMDTAKDVFAHPDLYKAYPDLGDSWVRRMRADAGNLGEYHAPGTKYPRDEIGIRGGLEDPRSTMLHEMQHAVQAREGFDPGTNTEVAGGYENYRRNIGEVEARNVQKRRNVPPQDLIYPRDTEDVPMLQQLHYAELPGTKSGSLGSGEESPLAQSVANSALQQASGDPDRAAEILRGKAQRAGSAQMEDLYNRASGIIAYHGSPHDFDKFDISKIGTGEGAQAYGHGLYFAENEGVAKVYAQAVRGQLPEAEARASEYLTSHGREAAIKELDRIAGEERNDFLKEANQKSADLLRSGWEPPSHTYQVAIKADPEHFLDWDKPLSEQHPKVQEAARKVREEAARADYERRKFPPELIEEYLGNARKRQDSGKMTGAVFVNAMKGNGVSAEASEQLRQAGIPGIRYLDQGSRKAFDLLDLKRSLAYWKENPDLPESAQRIKEVEQAIKEEEAKPVTRNYVVFDDKLVDILKKYGLAGLVASGAYHYQDGKQ